MSRRNVTRMKTSPNLARKKTSSNLARKKTSPNLVRKKTRKTQLKNSTENVRKYSSLTSYAMEFIELLNGGQVNLDKASEILAVPKRRLQDIVLVLEGSGLIEKVPGKKYRWKSESNTEPLREEIHRMEHEENELDRMIQIAETSLTFARKQNQENAYVSREHLKSLPDYNDGRSIFIQAEPNTQLFVTDDHKLTIKNENAPIACNVIDENEFVDIELITPDNKVGHEDSHGMQNFEEISNIMNYLCIDDDDNDLFLRSEDPFLIPMPSSSPESVENYNFTLDDQEGFRDLFNDVDFIAV